MKVIFIQNVAKQGKIGEIKEVANGFATNVLIPKKQAIIATKEAVQKLETEKQNKNNKLELDKNLFLKAINDLQNILNEKSGGFLEIKNHKQDKQGNLFSQIKDTDIVEAIYNLLKISFNPKQIILTREPIKKVGEYDIILKDKNIEKKLKILIK